MQPTSIETKSFFINFDNLSSKISSIDGIFLIIGKNGRGKTRLMAEIADGECTISSKDEIANHSVGIIYYSCTESSIRKKPVRNFYNCATRQSKKIKNSLLSEITLDFTYDGQPQLLIEYSQKFYSRTLKPYLYKILSPEQFSDTPTVSDLLGREIRIHLAENISKLNKSENEIVDILLNKFDSLIESIPTHYKILILSIAENHHDKSKSNQERKCILNNLLMMMFFTLRGWEGGRLYESETHETFKKEVMNAIDVMNNIAFKTDGRSMTITPENPNSYHYITHEIPTATPKASSIPSGIRQIHSQFELIEHGIVRLKRNGFSDIIVLIDEGDSFLHTEWQLKYIDILDNFLKKIKAKYNISTISAIISTHSPVIASEFTMDAIISLDGEITQPTLGAPIESLMDSAFKSTSMGSRAIRIISELKNNKDKGRQSEEDLKLINAIGDSVVRRILNS